MNNLESKLSGDSRACTTKITMRRRPGVSSDALALQKELGIKMDGIFGSGTEKAVIAFQKKHGIEPADGVVRDETWTALCDDSKACRAKNVVRMRKQYSSDALAVQKILGVEADGYFGRKTKAAVIAFQKKHGVEPADGVVTEPTWNALCADNSPLASNTEPLRDSKLVSNRA